MSTTGQYYKNNCQKFFDSSVEADVTSLYGHFLQYVQKGGKILDFGCGSGRDTKAFLEKGYDVEAVDGSEELCKLASSYTGTDVRCMDFFALDTKEKYDAIWACASILHVPTDKLPELLSKMRDAVVPQGIIYMSFKYGDFEGERDGRYFVDLNENRFLQLYEKVEGLKAVELWFSEDVRPGRDVTWYNVILRKI